MAYNKAIVAPLIIWPSSMFSNFWGAITPDGKYEKSAVQQEFLKRVRVCLWNVPCVAFVYLIQAKLLKNMLEKQSFDYSEKTTFSLCDYARNNDIFIYVSNLFNYGHLKVDYDPDRFHNDLYQLDSNRYDWEQRYVHPDYYKALQPNAKLICLAKMPSGFLILPRGTVKN